MRKSAVTDPIQVHSVRTRLIRGSVLNFLATGFNQGSTLIANIFVARILMKDGFGEFAMVQSTLLAMSTMVQLATGYTASKYVAEYRAVAPERAGRIMGLCAAVSVAMACLGVMFVVALAPWLSRTAMNAPHLAYPLTIGAGFLFFSAINGYQTGALSGLEAYNGLARAGVLSGIIAVGTISLGAWMGGLDGAFMGLSVSAFGRCIIHYVALNCESRARGITACFSEISKEWTVIRKFALPAAVAGYYSIPMMWLANSFLVRQPGGYGEMALYASSFSLRTIVLFVPLVINNVSLSILNNLKGSGDYKRYKRVYRWNVLIIFAATLAVALVFALFGARVLSVFGRGFRTGESVLQILMISTVLEGTSIALYQHLQVHGKMWTSLFLINVPRETLFVALAFYLVPSQGAIGLSLSCVVSWLLALAVISLLVSGKRLTRIPGLGGTISPQQRVIGGTE